MAEPIRVAHVMGKMVGGGVEQVVMNYYRHIDRSRVQFDFLVDADSTLVPKDEIESFGGRVFEIPPYQHQLAYQRALVPLLCDQGWKIVHSHINALSVFPLRAAKKAGVPVRIAHSHSASGKGGEEWAKKALKALLKTQSKRYSTHRMACSRFAGEWLFGKGSCFEVVYNAIELSKFSFNPILRERVRSELGISEKQLVVGHVGRFMPQKNHRFLIDVFDKVAQIRQDAILVLVGNGELEKQIKSLTLDRKISDRVHFLGQRLDMDAIYQAFDVFVLPSLYEGLGLVAIEAQRAGLPCFLSDRITREVDVTHTIRFLSINNPLIWANCICSTEQNERVDVDPEDFKSYDIGIASVELARRYKELSDRL